MSRAIPLLHLWTSVACSRVNFTFTCMHRTLTSGDTRSLRTANYGLLSIGELKNYSLLHNFLSKVDSLT
jgi:hypothetical protein